MQPDPLVLAYMAGIIDSDGYITITRSVRSGNLYHGAVIGVSGTRRQPHDLAASLWGGKVHLYTPKNPLHRGQYQWCRHGKAAAEAIEQIFPYLRVKQDQALLALELHENVENGRADDPFPWFGPQYDPIQARETMRQEMVVLLNQSRKRVGRVPA